MVLIGVAKTARSFENFMSFLESMVGVGYPTILSFLKSLSTGFKFEIFVYSLGIVYLVLL